MEVRIEIEREDDGRWLAEILERPGVLAYGLTRSAAITAVKALLLHVLADELQRGELPATFGGVAFTVT